MSTPTPQEMTLDAIRSVPLFSSLDDDAARELRTLLRVRDVPSGTPLFRAGDIGDAMYLIESGRVSITVTDEDKKQVVLAELAQGDFFGEMAIIDGKQRSADATVIDLRLKPAMSKRSVITCLPAPSVTGSVTFVQVCHEPVFGMLIVDQTLLGPLKPTCIEPPPFGEATRSCTV